MPADPSSELASLSAFRLQVSYRAVQRTSVDLRVKHGKVWTAGTLGRHTAGGPA